MKITGPTSKSVAVVSEIFLDKMHGNWSVSPIQKSTPTGFHRFINIELEAA